MPGIETRAQWNRCCVATEIYAVNTVCWTHLYLRQPLERHSHNETYILSAFIFHFGEIIFSNLGSALTAIEIKNVFVRVPIENVKIFTRKTEEYDKTPRCKRLPRVGGGESPRHNYSEIGRSVVWARRERRTIYIPALREK